jgi:HD-GYP domain-containing protein (c-di-GMP phosphodiesterase class II)
MSWYRDAETELIELADAVQSQRSVRIDRLEALAAQLVSALKQNDELIVEALSGPPGTPLVTNLVNAAILGTKVGIGLGYYGKELERLALAGLVHDIGLFAVPQSLVMKAGRLTHDERTLIEQHPELGYQVIRRIGPEYQWLAQVVRQAHERFHGQGYPNRLTGRQVCEMAQILGVVDVFDALVSDRPYRRRLFPHQAVKELLVAERSSFPREILKALVEQLSVYPLGTTVRLTTGEVGTVVHVNTRYPLRPVVKVNDDQDAGALREIDLSLTPLVSIIETLNPPVVGRVSFTGGTKAEAAQSVGLASDHFTSLLESLDAIASAIQGVVETRITPQEEPGTAWNEEDSLLEDRGQKAERSDPSFRKEIVGLFALEAREWLAQIQMALKKIGDSADTHMRSKLYGFMLNGISNLAKSASTVELVEIEAMASNLLPMLRDVGGAKMEAMSEAVRPLQAGLDRIIAAVQRLAGDQRTGEQAVHVPVTTEPQGEAEKTQDQGQGAAQEEEVNSALDPSPMPERVAGRMPLLSALRELQQARARSVQPARDILEAVIERAEQETEAQDHQINAESIERILRDLDRLDEEFLREVHQRVPVMTKVLAELRERGVADFVTASQLDPIVAHVESLHEVAKGLHAATITMFLQGVKSFLTMTAYRKMRDLDQRLEAVEERLNALIPMAEQWVSLGRLERAAIEEILPA